MRRAIDPNSITYPNPYYLEMVNLFGSSILAYWPLWEPSGAVITDIQNARNGAYHNQTLGVPGVGDGNTGVRSAGNAYGNVYTTGLRDNFNPSEFTIIMWFRLDPAQWADGVLRCFSRFASNFTNRIDIFKDSVANQLEVIYEGASGSDITRVILVPCYTSVWQCLAVTVSKSHDRFRVYLNGQQYGADTTAIGTWTASLLASDKCSISSGSGNVASNPTIGDQAHIILLNREASAAELEHAALYFGFGTMVETGDSKTAHGGWTQRLRDKLSDLQVRQWIDYNFGTSGYTAADLLSVTPAQIAATAHYPSEILINIGVNDIGGTITPPNDYKVSMNAIINLWHTAFPGAHIRMVGVWKRGVSPECAALRAKVAELEATYAWVKKGIDESLILPGSDDGATMTTDGIHYSETGKIAIANAWFTAMGH